LGEKYCVPIYAHTAGMNRYAGDPMFTFGEDPKTAYLLAGLSGAAFMQLPALGGYISLRLAFFNLLASLISWKYLKFLYYI
jgi:hypothetical protein